MPAWPVAPPKIGGCSPLHARPLRGPHTGGLRGVFPGRMSPEKRILVGSAGCGRRKSATLALPGESVGTERPADVCGACPAGRVRWDGRAGGYSGCPAGRVRWGGKAGGCLGRALPGESVGSERLADACGACPCRASPLRRKGQRIPIKCALPGESVGAERPADTYGVCPCRASLLGRKGRRMPAGQSVGMERPAEICDAFWVRCGNGFPAAGPCFRFGKIFLKLPHILRGSSVIQGERGRSHHGLGGPI